MMRTKKHAKMVRSGALWGARDGQRRWRAHWSLTRSHLVIRSRARPGALGFIGVHPRASAAGIPL